MFRLIIFLLMAGLFSWPDTLSHALQTGQTDICRRVDYVRIYDRLDALGIDVSSIIIGPLSAYLRASSRRVDGDYHYWPEDAAAILFEELPGPVRQIHIDDQTAGSGHGGRIYPSSAFRLPSIQVWNLADESGIRNISITATELSLFAANISSADLPELLVRLGASLDARQAVASVIINSGQRWKIHEQEFSQWQRLARKMQTADMFGDDFLLFSITSTGVHLTAKIQGSGSGAEKVLKRRTCFGRQVEFDDYSTFSTVTVP